MQTLKATLNTGGDGLWSNTAAAVQVTGIDLAYVNEERDFGELRVYFTTKSWNVKAQGLIYTDELFKQQLNALLATHGLTAADYSEQGMQGNNYVSLDVNKRFIKAYADKYGMEQVDAVAY